MGTEHKVAGDMEDMHLVVSLVPRPLPDFISQLWRKIELR